MYSASILAIVLLYSSHVFAAFGVTTVGSSFRVDTDAGLIYDIAKSNGDIVSMIYNGVQLQSTEKHSAINSGLGSSSVSATVINGYVKVTVKSNGNPVTQYFVAKKGVAIIFMGTYITDEVDPGELRWLARMNKGPIPNGVHEPVSDIAGCTAFEGKDTFRCSNGQTRCKMYSSDRFIDDIVHGATGPDIGVWMIVPGTAYETSSGGPFMRDINSQTGDQQELYWYMNSGHVRTEPWRFGLMGPYAMALLFSTGAKPSIILDTSFFAGLDIQGYVPESSRGRVSGKATGVPNEFETVLHWYNSKAQYWVKATGGVYTSPLMKPGTYTVKMYKGEYPVAQSSVTVTTGQTVLQDLSSSEPTTSAIFRIGEFDGQPFELKNGDKIERMHPSDPRMAKWGGKYGVSQSKASDFPMALFGKEGGDAEVTFTLVAKQIVATKLRISTTLSFKGGRPSVKMNSWVGADPGAPRLIDSRGVTRGAYRGYGEQYSWDIPASALRVGTNTLTIGTYGSGDSSFLSANWIVDAIELQGPSNSNGSPSTTIASPPGTTLSSTTRAVPSSTRVTETPGSCSAAEYSQCGGLNFSGCKTCQSGTKCVYSNDYYSQCMKA